MCLPLPIYRLRRRRRKSFAIILLLPLRSLVTREMFLSFGATPIDNVVQISNQGTHVKFYTRGAVMPAKLSSKPRRHPGWRSISGSVVRASVFDWRTFPDMRLIYG